MQERPSVQGLLTGKLPPELLREVLAEAAVAAPEVRLGPALGEDACAIEVGGGVLVAATDPITLTGAGVGSHAVVINANDVAVMGVRPRWFLAVVLLPEGSAADEVRALLAGMRRTLDALGAVLVGGHTEVTTAVSQPLVVGQMLGFAADGRFVSTGGAAAGQHIVQVGPAPVEAAAVLAAAGRGSGVEAEVRARASAALEDPGISVVEAALAAAELGASALHDPTEGGLSAGLHELAEASGVALQVDAEAVLWFEPGRALCRAAGADPWGALASGALLAAFEPERLAGALETLAARGFAARAVARAVEGAGVTCDGAPLPRFDRDEVARVLTPK
jgi:hydrogenase maturation factor